MENLLEYTLEDNILDVIKKILPVDIEVNIVSGIAGVQNLITSIEKRYGENLRKQGIVNLIITNELSKLKTQEEVNEKFKREELWSNHYTYFEIPELEHVRIFLRSSLDLMNDNDETNPYIQGFRKSSYSYTILFNSSDSSILSLC